MTNIFKIFTELRTDNNSDDIIVAKKISTKNNYRIGKDKQGYPCILIQVDLKKNRTSSLPISLENLQVIHNIECKILETNVIEDNFTLIRCKSDNQNLYEYFLNLVYPLIMTMGNEPTEYEINDFINKILELFISISESPKKSIQGLWAELFIISESRNKKIFIEAWHDDPYDEFDFKYGSTKLEVKSTSGRVRKHNFNFFQLLPIENEHIYIASLLVEANPKGLSIKELLNKIQIDLKENLGLIEKMNKIIFLSMGNEWKNYSEEKFDFSFAKKTLKFYNSTYIPCINKNIPKEISEIHFTVDLTDVIDIQKSEKKGNEFLKYI
jgi:hypothetical protein